MNTLIQTLREIIGNPNFYDVNTSAWDFGAMCEYFACVILVVVVVTSVFRILGKLVSR